MPAATIVITEYLVSFGCIVFALVAVTTEERWSIFTIIKADLYCFFIFALWGF